MNDLQSIGKLLLLVGVSFALVGVALWVAGRWGFAPPPGNLKLSGEKWSCYVPIGLSILLSLLLTLILNLVLRASNK